MNADLRIETPRWTAEVSLYGGQLLRASCTDSSHPVIWLGSRARSGGGQAIRGGVPICWPWFGASPVPGRPSQGFARLCQWELEQLGSDFVRMRLPGEQVSPELRDFPFELSSEIRLGESLELSLQMKNTGPKPIGITLALHTYLAVGDCEKVRLFGLEQAPFTVKGGPELHGGTGPLAIRGECCRLYCPQTEPVRIYDPVWNRTITVEKENSRSTLIWNPGPERALQIADLAPEEYRQFICVEANRAGTDFLALVPHEPVTIRQRIRVDDQAEGPGAAGSGLHTHGKQPEKQQ